MCRSVAISILSLFRWSIAELGNINRFVIAKPLGCGNLNQQCHCEESHLADRGNLNLYKSPIGAKGVAALRTEGLKL